MRCTTKLTNAIVIFINTRGQHLQFNRFGRNVDDHEILNRNVDNHEIRNSNVQHFNQDILNTVTQAVLFPADAHTLSAGNLNELTGIMRGNPRVMSMHEEFKRL